MDKSEKEKMIETINKWTEDTKKEIADICDGKSVAGQGEMTTLYERDPKRYRAILKYAIDTGEIKVSLIFKEFNIGFAVASAYINDFEDQSFIEYDKHKRKWKIVITKEQYNNLFAVTLS